MRPWQPLYSISQQPTWRLTSWPHTMLAMQGQVAHKGGVVLRRWFRFPRQQLEHTRRNWLRISVQTTEELCSTKYLERKQSLWQKESFLCWSCSLSFIHIIVNIISSKSISESCDPMQLFDHSIYQQELICCTAEPQVSPWPMCVCVHKGAREVERHYYLCYSLRV